MYSALWLLGSKPSSRSRSRLRGSISFVMTVAPAALPHTARHPVPADGSRMTSCGRRSIRYANKYAIGAGVENC